MGHSLDLGETKHRTGRSCSSSMCHLFFTFKMLFLCLSMFLMAGVVTAKQEQRANLKFLVKSGCGVAEAWRRLRAVFGDSTMSQTQVRVWAKRFREGENNINDRPRPGRPKSKRTAANIRVIRDLVENDGRWSVRSLCNETGLTRHVV